METAVRETDGLLTLEYLGQVYSIEWPHDKLYLAMDVNREVWAYTNEPCLYVEENGEPWSWDCADSDNYAGYVFHEYTNLEVPINETLVQYKVVEGQENA